MIKRTAHSRTVERLLASHPAVALLGARQVGKTTLAKALAARWEGPTHYFDLEYPPDIARLADPYLALESLKGLVILDEVQRTPAIFPVLRVLADRPGTPARFLILGSASPDLLRQDSESLAGRLAIHELTGFNLAEVSTSEINRLWLRGGFPRAYTANADSESSEWRANFIRTFLERDIPQLGIRIPAITLDRFWSMIAHYHAQVWNGSELARAFGVSHHTVRRYLEVLESTFMVRVLKPWHANLKKRQVKSPKVYIRDSGILHELLGLRTADALERHPKIGASWEGFWIENVIRAFGLDPRRCWFWRTHGGEEIDLVVDEGWSLRGFEVKRTSAPALTRSIKAALEDLGLDRIDVIHAGPDSFRLAERVWAVSSSRLLDRISPLATDG